MAPTTVSDDVTGTFRLERVCGDHVLLDAEQYRVLVELVHGRFEEGDGEGAGERGDALTQCRPVPAADT